jgi:hypothetical protein
MHSTLSFEELPLLFGKIVISYLPPHRKRKKPFTLSLRLLQDQETENDPCPMKQHPVLGRGRVWRDTL